MPGELVGAGEALLAAGEGAGVGLLAGVGADVPGLVFETVEGSVAERAFVRSAAVVVVRGEQSRGEREGGSSPRYARLVDVDCVHGGLTFRRRGLRSDFGHRASFESLDEREGKRWWLMMVGGASDREPSTLVKRGRVLPWGPQEVAPKP